MATWRRNDELGCGDRLGSADFLRSVGFVSGITTATVEEILRRIEEWHSKTQKRGIELVVLFCAGPVSGAWYRAIGARLLPVDLEWINGLKAWPSKVVPMFTMDETRLFSGVDS